MALELEHALDGLRLRPLSLDQSDAYLRAFLIQKMPWKSLQEWPMTTSSAYFRKETSDSEQDGYEG